MFKAKYLVFIITSVVAIARCRMEGFIVGGSRAPISEHPYSAYLSMICGSDEKSMFVCGSSIINQKILLTAGHCLQSCKSISKVTISAGSSEKNKGHKTTAYAYAIHENYKEPSSENDIGLVRSKLPFTFSDKISKVALMNNPPQRQDGEVAGWGLVNEERLQQANSLMKLSQVMWQKNECENLYGRIPQGTFCAANPHRDKYIASGDSGSAFVINGYIQIGLVSYKIPKKSKFLVVYTNVTYFLRWIQFNAKRLYCAKF